MFDITPYPECIADVHPKTLRQVIAVESGGNPIAINVNGTRQPAKPKNREDAVKLAYRDIKQGYSVDMGLMQVNSKNQSRYGVTVEQMFEPCANLNTGSQILYDAWLRASQLHSDPQQARLTALSIYNTGHPERGFRNGYVRKYTHNGTVVAPQRIASARTAGTTLDFGDFYD